MIAATKPPQQATPRTLDVYLGFEIRQHPDGTLVAIPAGWTHRDATVLEARDLPTLRMRIWSWWHRLLD